MDRLHTGVDSGPWSIPRVAAFVRPVVGRSADPEGLALFCREHLAVHKTPRIWQTVEDFPQTAAGKIQKFVLRSATSPRKEHPRPHGPPVER
jgi:fatty-acyl-CoA synthase